MLLVVGNYVEKIFADIYDNRLDSGVLTGTWEHAIQMCSEQGVDLPPLGHLNREDYIGKIKKYNPDHIPPNSNPSSTKKIKTGNCYVATAVYGSYDCPPVWTLRRYRDQILAATWYGRGFIRFYYAISPRLVKRFGKTTWFTKTIKPLLDSLVEKLRAQGLSADPYTD